jgi:hypothetical protein
MGSGARRSPALWLTSRRLYVHGWIFALCLWSSFLWIFSAPGIVGRNGVTKGSDFVHFYTLGSLAREHRGSELYDMAAQSDLALRKVPQAGRLFFVPLYGPQVSLLFAPLAALPYSAALALWLTLNTAIYGVCCYAVWKTCPNLSTHGRLVLILALGYPAFFHLLVWGQTSGLALVCFTLAYLALRSEHGFAAGLAIGCLMFKPQLALAAAFVFLLAGEWSVVFGAILSAAAQLAVGLLYFDAAVMRDYLHHLLRVKDVLAQLEPRPYQMHSLRAFWTMLIPSPGVAFGFYIVSALAVLVWMFFYWKSPAPLGFRYTALLITTVLVAPHLTVYDLVILAPALLLLGNEAVANADFAHRAGWLIYLCYALPLIGPLSRWTHLQLSVVAMVALIWTVGRFRVAREASNLLASVIALA